MARLLTCALIPTIAALIAWAAATTTQPSRSPERGWCVRDHGTFDALTRRDRHRATDARAGGSQLRRAHRHGDTDASHILRGDKHRERSVRRDGHVDGERQLLRWRAERWRVVVDVHWPGHHHRGRGRSPHASRCVWHVPGPVDGDQVAREGWRPEATG